MAAKRKNTTTPSGHHGGNKAGPSQQPVSSSWLSNNWKKISAAAIGILGTIGVITYRKAHEPGMQVSQEQVEKNSRVGSEKALYGSLYPYKDTIPKLMLAEREAGKIYRFEDFLPGLKQVNNRFQVNVYIGKPPVVNGAQVRLEEVPGDLKDKVKLGFEKWSDYCSFTYVNDPGKADLNVYVESRILPAIGIGARAIMPDNWKRPGWASHPEDSAIVGKAILIGAQNIQADKAGPDLLSNNIGHEFGHQLGLDHPDVEFYYKIILGRKHEELTGKDAGSAAAILRKIDNTYPEFEKLSIMNAVTTDKAPAQNVGALDKKAMEIILRLFREKYGPHTGISSMQDSPLAVLHKTGRATGAG
jgi:hypothetical protein